MEARPDSIPPPRSQTGASTSLHVAAKELPSEDELMAASEAADGGSDDAERIARRVATIVKAWNRKGIGPSATPSFADLGRLWSFADALETTGAQYLDQAEQIRGSLGALDCMRRDIPLREAGEAMSTVNGPAEEFELLEERLRNAVGPGAS